MQVFDTVSALRKFLAAHRAAGKRIGLVPTMGYLHAGHVKARAHGGGHFAVRIVSVAFAQLPMVARHQAIYTAYPGRSFWIKNIVNP